MNYNSGAVSPGNSISRAWNLVSGNMASFVVATFVLGLVMFVAYFVLALINQAVSLGLMMAAGQNPFDFSHQSSAATSVLGVGATIGGMIFGFVVNFILATFTAIMLVGYFKFIARSFDDEFPSVGDIFSGFEHLRACAVTAAISTLIQIVLTVIAGIVVVAVAGIGSLGGGFRTLDPTKFTGFLPLVIIFALVVIIVGTVWFSLQIFVNPLIADRGMSGLDAFKLSIEAGWANLGGLIVLLLMLGLIYFATILVAMALVGIAMAISPFLILFVFLFMMVAGLILFPTFYASMFAAYRDVFGVQESNPRAEAPPTPQSYGFMDAEG